MDTTIIIKKGNNIFKFILYINLKNYLYHKNINIIIIFIEY